jgi:hypothetical protein
VRRAALALIAAVFLAGSSGAFAESSPIPSLTPGATDPRVTQATISQTICKTGYTKTVRNVSTQTKHRVYTEYEIATSSQHNYVIDHLVPLEVGGSNAIENLWPEAKADAKTKDKIEGALHARVCSGAVDLTTAQRAFESDWTTALTNAATTTTTTSTSTTTTTAPPPPPPTQAPVTAPPETAPPQTEPPQTEPPAPGGGATALCNDGTLSYAANHQGACSHHGGVAQFYK